MTNKSRTLYVGLTNNIKKRIYEHKNKLIGGFTKKYNIDRLLYLKTIKGWLRKKKIELVNQTNPNWADLSQDWYE
jgi:putative endonuclease